MGATHPHLFAAQLFQAGLAAAELTAAYLGIRLGLYEALAAGGPATAGQLSARAGIAPRYAQEWLEQQAVCGIVEVDAAHRPAEERLYLLPPAHAEVLLNADARFYMAPIALLPVGGIGRAMPQVLDAYRSGSGVSFADYGPDFRDSQAALNRPVFRHYLPEWIKTCLPELHAALQEPGCRVADVACGLGWSSIALAQTYPGARIEGFDREEDSIRLARLNARQSGVDDRVLFHQGDITGPDLHGRYRLVCIFDALHDMADPIDVLRQCHELVAADGSALLMEPNAADRFAVPTTDTERFLYAISVLHCLPVGMSEQPSAATGTLLRPDTVRAYGLEAGFRAVDVLRADHRFYRLYHLRR
jgi:2-polyprenyl-3-methyl-5-hydroxy-6-metoxy-1,4-benzoquinol methylase